ncbi:hypothetical protein [Sigmofec virus UA08Rod_4888]|uniref:Uncharacterized protein n=1 Tax=Sigmofec virus UA08Rod_4888 TaxID=2929412 RepID=A0A976N196_9VIRU|nr:hypothetical protein [Sigmofec virus UA08Rod_4888]
MRRYHRVYVRATFYTVQENTFGSPCRLRECGSCETRWTPKSLQVSSQDLDDLLRWQEEMEDYAMQHNKLVNFKSFTVKQ